MAEARVDLAQLARNIEVTRRRLGSCHLLFPVKADAYGHGAVRVARLAQEVGVDYFGVAHLSEALELRRAGITTPILIMSASRPAHLPQLVEAGVDVTLSSLAFARQLDEAARLSRRRVRVQVKVDTGMGRNGIWWEEAPELVRALGALPALELVGIFTHFSCAYSTEPDDRAFTLEQLRAFNRLLDELARSDLLPPLRHIANSSGLIQYEDQVTTGHFNLVRPGILLYGAPEVRRPWTEPIQPILTLRTWVTSVTTLAPGRTIGYGRSYRAATARRIATLPVGYADGISWWLKNRGEVLIHGRRAPMVGGISMDQLTVDVSDLPHVAVDDEVYLIHRDLPAMEIAHKVGAHFSEIVLTALSRRVARVYSLPCAAGCA